MVYLISCCLYSKGKNFRANHNAYAKDNCSLMAVVYIAKVRILEQITTAGTMFRTVPQLLFI